MQEITSFLQRRNTQELVNLYDDIPFTFFDFCGGKEVGRHSVEKKL